MRDQEKTTEHLSELQKLLFDILLALHKILDEKNIGYFLLGGTLLGAVRHNGFIPWDDDIDIGMLRDDYEYFLENISDALPEHLELRTYSDNSSHHYYFCRIVDTRFHLERTGSLAKREEEVWVDIFPLDGMPNNFFLRKIHMLRLLITRAKYHIACFEHVNLQRPNRPLLERIIIAFIQFSGWGRKANAREKLEHLDKLLKKHPVENSNWIVNFMGQYKFKEMFHKKVYGQGATYQFESLELMGPEDADFVLTQMYGEYMTPPDPKDRNVHAAEFVNK